LVGCSIGGGIMIIGGVLELLLGVVAEGRELELVTPPADPGHGDPDPASAKCPGHPARRPPTAARIRGRLTGRYHS
jgi:hypothetical protein